MLCSFPCAMPLGFHPDRPSINSITYGAVRICPTDTNEKGYDLFVAHGNALPFFCLEYFAGGGSSGLGVEDNVDVSIGRAGRIGRRFAREAISSSSATSLSLALDSCKLFICSSGQL